MTRKSTPQRPATLIPFDPVATLNEFVGLLHRLDFLSGPFESSVYNRRCSVKYSTIAEGELRKKLRGCDHVEIALFDPPLKLSWGSKENPVVEIRNDADVPEAKGLRFVEFSEIVDPATDLILECGRNFGPSTLIAWTTQEFFKSASEGDGWDDFLADRRLFWTLAYQHTERLELRLMGGNPQYLDADPSWLEAMNELCAIFRRIVERWKLTQLQPPRWLSSRKPKPPMTTAEIAELQLELTKFGSAFSLMRCPVDGGFTNDPRAVELGFLLLLPLEYHGTVNEAVALSWDLPERCHFVEREPTEDEKANRYYASCRTFARCDRCGFSFASQMVDADELPRVFCGCGTEASTAGVLPALPSGPKYTHIEKCIWRELHKAKEGSPVTRSQIAESAGGCVEMTVSRHMETLLGKVPGLQNRIRSQPGHGGGWWLEKTDESKTC